MLLLSMFGRQTVLKLLALNIDKIPIPDGPDYVSSTYSEASHPTRLLLDSVWLLELLSIFDSSARASVKKLCTQQNALQRDREMSEAMVNPLKLFQMLAEKARTAFSVSYDQSSEDPNKWKQKCQCF